MGSWITYLPQTVTDEKYPFIEACFCTFAYDILFSGYCTSVYSSKELMGARLSEVVPGVYFFLSSSNKEKKTDYPHHNANFLIDEDVLADGAEGVAEILLQYAALADSGFGRVPETGGCQVC